MNEFNELFNSAVQFIKQTLSVLGDLKNFLTWIAILIAFWFLVRKIVKFAFALKKFLKGYGGFTIFNAFYVSILCRKDSNNLIRMFMEYCVLTIKPNVTYLTHNEWNDKIHEFSSLYVHNIRKKTDIGIKNTFLFINENIKNRIQQYFNFFDEEMKSLFSVYAKDVPSFICEINIEKGYVVPFVQIFSLQDAYESNWSTILKKYVDEAKGNNIFQTDISSLYSWLMWGPSLIYNYSNDNRRLCLYGLGDESYATKLVLKDGEDNKVINKLGKNKFANGLFLSGKFKIYSQSEYFKKYSNDFGINANYFIEKYKHIPGFLLEATEKIDVDKLSTNDCNMFTAYIWILIYYRSINDADDIFRPENVTVFFEHANLIDENNVALLKNVLIDKCIKYLETIFSNEKYNDRIYSFPMALSNDILDDVINVIKCKQTNSDYKYNKEFLSRIELNTNLHEYDYIISRLEDRFNPKKSDIKYIEIDFNDINARADFGEFYAGIYMREFPDENERESIDNMIKQYNSNDSDYRYHCILAMHENKVLGGIIGDYFKEVNAGAIEFVVVDSSCRSKGLGRSLKDCLIDTFNKDAKEMGKEEVSYVFFETEDYKKVSSDITENARKRVGFWDRIAAKKVDISYIQPALDINKKDVDYLSLAVLIANENVDTKSLDSKYVRQFLYNYFKYAFGIENINNINAMKRMDLSDFNVKSTINIVRLIN